MFKAWIVVYIQGRFAAGPARRFARRLHAMSSAVVVFAIWRVVGTLAVISGINYVDGKQLLLLMQLQE